MKWKVIIKFLNERYIKLNSAKINNNRYRSMAYKKVHDIIKDQYDENDTVTIKKIDKLDISDNMKIKFKFYLKNPSKIPSSEKHTLLHDLIKIKGIGSTKAKELIKMGIKNTNQLKLKKYNDLLSDQTKIFIKLKPETKIPNEKIKSLEPIIINLLKEEMIIVGSYRRKTKFSKDIDVMIVSESNSSYNNNHELLEKVIIELKKKIGEKNVHEYISGDVKISVIVKFSHKYYKIDFFRTEKKNKWAMLLYSTGSQSFNIRMRSIAKKKGYLLNQNGLYKRKTMKLLSGKATGERFFFNKLDMMYIKPINRN